MTDEELFKRWDEVGVKINGWLYPYRWYLIGGALLLGLFAGIYF